MQARSYKNAGKSTALIKLLVLCIIMSGLIYSTHFASTYYSVLDFLPLFCKFCFGGPVQCFHLAASRKVVHKVRLIRHWGQSMLVFMHPNASSLVNE